MHTKSSNLEIQSRACEYGQLFRFSAIKGQLLEAMPALDEATYMARFNAPALVASGPSLTTVRPLVLLSRCACNHEGRGCQVPLEWLKF